MIRRLFRSVLNMTEARANPSLGGYDEKFVNVVEDDLQCGICQFTLKDPMLTKCGHRFCRQCLDEHLKSQENAGARLTCPVDRSILIPSKDLFPDKATERKILSLSVRCPSEGCQWTGELRSKDVHLESCPLKVVSCSNANCNETMTRNNLQAHATKTCRWRILQCKHCSVSHPACQTQAHGLKCKRKPVNCPKNCGAVIPREELSAHDQKECPLTVTSCPFAQMGCTRKVQRGQMEIHLQAAVKPHLDLTCAELNSTQEKLKISQEATNDLSEKVFALENQWTSFQKTFDTQRLAINNIKDVGERIDALGRKLNTFKDRLTVLEDKVKTTRTFRDNSNNIVLPGYSGRNSMRQTQLIPLSGRRRTGRFN